ncbi:MAG: tetratricopeptide repeat protein [Rhodocyclaceae bacterium]|nr:MAG: tetratricopeptide repeat protein [Rhodocyclaceae bacterium]
MSHRKTFKPSPQAVTLQKQVDNLIKLFSQGQWENLQQDALDFLRSYPKHIFGKKALAASFIQLGHPEMAIPVLQDALSLSPRDAELHSNLAGAYVKTSQFDEARQSALTAIEIASNNQGAYCNLGLACRHLGVWQQALAAYSRAIELNPKDFISLNNAGVALIEMEHPEQAIVCLKAALELKPDYDEAKWNLGRAHEDLKIFNNASEVFYDVLRKDPNNFHIRVRLNHTLRNECRFQESEEQTQHILKALREPEFRGDTNPFAILSIEGSNRADQKKAGYAHAEAIRSAVLSSLPLFSPKENFSTERPLRIGYLSADLHHHATAMLLVGVLEARNPAHTQVYLYSHGPDDGSSLRKRLENACEAFRNILSLSYSEAAKAIADDGIDILVDLKGYTKGERLNICALRPAPIVVSWLGYPGSLGHPRLADYIIGDPVVTPLDHQAEYSETLALMPNSYQPNDRKRPLPEKLTRAALGLPEQGLVFCSFNQTHKIIRPVFTQWCRLLRETPDSVLWLMVTNEAARNNLLTLAAEQGVSASRFVFAPFAHIDEHLGRLQQADIALDTFPYGSHTTGSDALWAGVPLIAIKGDTFASRVSSSLLTAVGLPELITDSPEAACDLALGLTREPHRLAAIRNHLETCRLTYPLFDTENFALNLQRLYFEMWHQYQSGTRSPITLAPIQS